MTHIDTHLTNPNFIHQSRHFNLFKTATRQKLSFWPYFVLLSMQVREQTWCVPGALSEASFSARASRHVCVHSSVANLATLSLDLATFFLKRLATNLTTFGKTLATFQMSPVLSYEREILSYTSPCVCSDQWPLAPAERSSTFHWPHGSWHRCQWAAHVHTVLPRTNHLPASPLFEIKLFNLTIFSSAFFYFYLMHLYYSLSVTEL